MSINVVSHTIRYINLYEIYTFKGVGFSVQFFGIGGTHIWNLKTDGLVGDPKHEKEHEIVPIQSYLNYY